MKAVCRTLALRERFRNLRDFFTLFCSKSLRNGRLFQRGTVVLAFITALSVLEGCRPRSPQHGGRVPPAPNAPARYGDPTPSSPKQIHKARTPVTSSSDWSKAPFYMVQSELSPAMVVHSSTKYLGLFLGTTNYGLGAPSFVAWATPNGPRSFKTGEKLDVSRMDQSWVLVWWANAEGWTDWDAPWVVYLQHKPDAMRLDHEGLHLEFPSSAGDVVLLPLYGYDKPLQREREAVTGNYRARTVKIKTWEWPEILTRDPLTRIRYWAAVTREFPIYCEETFSIDRARDAVVYRSQFSWLSIPDDWRTFPAKLSPLSAPLGHAIKIGGFPAELSGRWFDLNYATPSGPLLAVEGDGFETTLRVLQYVNETEVLQPPTNSNASINAAIPILTNEARKLTEFGLGKAANQWCESLVAAKYLAQSLPILGTDHRSNSVAALQRFFEGAWPTTERCVDARGNILEAHSIRSLLLNALWTYAHFSDEWALVKQRWPEIRQVMDNPGKTRWAGFAPDHISANGDQATSWLAFARLAYKAGDMDAYHYGCSMFAREVTHLFIKQRGIEYFREHQPWHALAPIDEEAFLTELDGPAGWNFDGPNFPATAVDRKFTNRWSRFQDPDVARFYRDYLQDDVKRELTWLRRRSDPKMKYVCDPAGLPSIPQLDSLLSDAPADISPENFGGPSGMVLANCLAVLRRAEPTRFERLIPGGAASPYVTGLERVEAGPNPVLLTELHFETSESSRASWPRLVWSRWKTPTGAPWTFGAIRPVHSAVPSEARVIPLNWNTRVVAWTWP